MLPDHHLQLDQLFRLNFNQLSDVEIPFIEKDYYTAFLQEIGVVEIRNDTAYSLVSQDGRSWSVCLEDVAAAMMNMQTQGALTSQEALFILQFVIEKMDRKNVIPRYVISYVCRDAVKRVVLRRFNEAIGESYENLTELSYKISDHIEEANEIINSIRFCDPAIGSGHFLISLMNEIVAIKSQLGVLADNDGNPLFRFRVVTDNESNLLVYDRKNFNTFKFRQSESESRHLQSTLLREKCIILDNCLFGADIEPFSVSICKLRLWVELLKHICLEVNKIPCWPIFEGNIRCGDALVSRFPLWGDMKNVFKHIKYSVADYKKYVSDFKSAKSKEDKKTFSQFIDQIKKKIFIEITLDDQSLKELQKWQKELAVLTSPGLFDFDDFDDKALKSKHIEVQLMVDKYKRQIEAIQNNPVYEHAIEWRYEFPELLNESGDFMGFDCIVGNPPDSHNQVATESPESNKQIHYNINKCIGDVPELYYELGYSLLKPTYYLSYITSNSWMQSILAEKMRLYLLKETDPLLVVEFEHTKKQNNTLSAHGIAILQKARNRHRMMTCQIKDKFDPQVESLEDYIRQNSELFINETEDTAVSQGFSVLTNVEKRIKAKIDKIGTPLMSWDIQMYSGIRTGCDDAFVIDGKTKDEFILADYKNTDIIKPLLLGENIKRYKFEPSNLWLICIPWHFPLLYDKNIKSASEKAKERFRQQYPVIFNHLVKFKEQLFARNPKEVGVLFEWYAVQHLGTSKEWDDFTQPKIVWKREAPSPNFCLDYSGCAIMDTTCFMTGQRLKYLLGVLNSKHGRFMLRDTPRLLNRDVQINILTLEAMKIPVPNVKIESEMISLVNKRTSDAYQSEYNDIDDKINQFVYDMYELDTEERTYIDQLKIENFEDEYFE